MCVELNTSMTDINSDEAVDSHERLSTLFGQLDIGDYQEVPPLFSIKEENTVIEDDITDITVSTSMNALSTHNSIRNTDQQDHLHNHTLQHHREQKHHKEVSECHNKHRQTVTTESALNGADASTRCSRCLDEQTNALFGGDEDGDTLLHISILNNEERIVFHIIQMAPDFTYLSVANNLNQTPLHFAVLTKQLIILRRLICAGADLDARDISGNTPLHLACFLGYTDIARLLLTPIEYKETLINRYQVPFQRIPQNMNTLNYEGYGCLHLAIVNNHPNIVRLLMEKSTCIDLNLGHGKSGRTGLHLAVETGNLQMIDLLMGRENMHVDESDFDGLTSFQLALGRGNQDAQRILIQNGATYKTLEIEEESDIDLSQVH